MFVCVGGGELTWSVDKDMGGKQLQAMDFKKDRMEKELSSGRPLFRCFPKTFADEILLHLVLQGICQKKK